MKAYTQKKIPEVCGTCSKWSEKFDHTGICRHRINVAYRPDQERKVGALMPKLDEMVQKMIDEAEI